MANNKTVVYHTIDNVFVVDCKDDKPLQILNSNTKELISNVIELNDLSSTISTDVVTSIEPLVNPIITIDNDVNTKSNTFNELITKIHKQYMSKYEFSKDLEKEIQLW